VIRDLSLKLAGATGRDRLFACIGALIGIGLTGLLGSMAFAHGVYVPLLVAPIGASAVLLFAVPSSPLAQPWSVIGGNTISAFVGIAVVRVVADPMVGAGLAVSLAIATMSLMRCLHPPGGAAALLPVLGGAQVAAAGWLFALVPVGTCSVLLTVFAYIFHKFSRHSYPHAHIPPPTVSHATRDIPPATRIGFNAEDIDAALRDLGETFDIDRDDLGQILERVELHALERSHGYLRCADIMSRDIIKTAADAEPDGALAKLIEHDLQVLPVVDQDDRVLGCVSFRELMRSGRQVSELMSSAWTAAPNDSISDLIAPLTSGMHHAVIVVDDDRLVGMVTQTDLLASLGRPPTIT